MSASFRTIIKPKICIATPGALGSLRRLSRLLAQKRANQRPQPAAVNCLQFVLQFSDDPVPISHRVFQLLSQFAGGQILSSNSLLKLADQPVPPADLRMQFRLQFADDAVALSNLLVQF